MTASLACVVLAHTDPEQVRRTIAALDPFPVFLHCDSATSDDVHERMTRDLPSRVVLLPRRRTPWAGWGSVAAELDGYRAALATTSATHVATLSGSDHPLVSSQEVLDVLGEHPGRSIIASAPMPHPDWSLGGWWRLRFRFRPHGKRMLLWPLPRRLPRGVVPAGGSQMKVLAREHVAAVVAAVDARPELVRFWRTTWIPDETFVPTLLHTPSVVPGWAEEHVDGSAWVILWRDPRQKSPSWLTTDDLGALVEERRHPRDGVPKLFARKFSSALSGGLLDVVDAHRTGAPLPDGGRR